MSNKEFIEKLVHICATYAEKTAIVYMRDDGSKTLFTFGEIHERIIKAQGAFEKAGLRKGDRAAVIAPHSPFAIFAGLSLAYTNMTSVLIDASLPSEEINRLLEYSDVRAIFTVPNIYEGLDKSLVSDVPIFDLSNDGKEYVLFDGSVSTASKQETPDPHRDVIAILFSSGTTDSMKGVMITYLAFLESIRLFSVPSKITDKSSFLYVLPFHHMAGFTGGLTCLFSGCSVGMIENVTAPKLQKGLAEFEPSIFSMVPRVYDVMAQKMKNVVHEKGIAVESAVKFLLAASGLSRRYLGINIGKHIFAKVNRKVFGKNFWGLGTGASLCSKETTRFFLNLGFEWANFYALTETNVPTVSTGAFDRYPIEGVGRVDRYDGIKIRIDDPDENGIGEIRVKTILIMKGYFRDPKLTAAAFDEDGYFKTGDLGYIDKKNYLHITGRQKEAIVLDTGKKVAPFDVDSLYGKLCPDINVACVGVPVGNGGFDEIHLFVENAPKEKQGEIKQAIKGFSGDTSAIYHIARVHFVEKLPTTSVGKVKRFKLQELALNERQRAK